MRYRETSRILIYELKNDSVELSYERVSQRGLTKGFTKGLTKGVRTKLIKLASSAPHPRRSVKREVLI